MDFAPRTAGLTLPAQVHHAFQGSRRDRPGGDPRCLRLPLTSAEPGGVPVLTALRIPDPQFPTETPAGRRSNRPVTAPGGQPDPSTSAAGGACAEQLRWARCPDDARAPLLMAAAGSGLGVPVVIQASACAGQPTSLPVRWPGAHLHPRLRRVGSAGSST